MEKHIPHFDVAIIGAGWSGLLACKYCLAEGLRPIVLESRDCIGGVWHYTDDERYAGVMKTTRTTSSRCLTEISDFPMPADYPDFPSHPQISAYLDAYCSHFFLNGHIALNQHVERIVKAGDRWQITAVGGGAWSATNVIVASGVHRHPNDVSADRRFEGYSGTLVHSAAVKEISADYTGKSIIVWGGGESASDIAYELSTVAGSVYWCIPNGQWFVPRVVDRWPPFPSARRKIVDHTTSRIRLLLSPTHQYSPFIYQYLEYAFGFNGHGQPAWRTAAPYNRSFFNKSAEVLDRVKSGHVIPKRDISGCDGKRVCFTDGSNAVVDRIITCSGYRIAFPFFVEPAAPGADPRKWFKHIFFDPDPSLAFVGFVRPIFGSIPGIAELQSRYVAKVFFGDCRLPDRPERLATIDRDIRFWQHHFRFTSQRLAGLVDHYLYCNQLARLIGCYPNFRSLLLSSPRRWWQAVLAPWNGCQFWLNEPKHHERIFPTFRRYDENRISQNYIFLALAPLLPLIGVCTHLRVVLSERFGRNQRLARWLSEWRQGNLAFGPAVVVSPALATVGVLAGASMYSIEASRDVVGAEFGRVARNSSGGPAPLAQSVMADVTTSPVEVVARIVEMLSGERSRIEADRYIDPQITIHMDATIHRGLILWQKWLYLIRNCGRVHDLRLVVQELTAERQDPAIVHLVGRWTGVGKYDGLPRQASHFAHFRYRLSQGRVAELWTQRTNYDFIVGDWLRFRLFYRLYLGWAIWVFWRLNREEVDYRLDRPA